MAPTVPGQLTVSQDTFGGLRLDVDPLELGFTGAVDMLDVETAPDGSLLARPGFQRWSADTTNLGADVTWIWSDGASDVVVVAYGAGFSSNADLINGEDGDRIAHQATSAEVTGAVQYSGPTSTPYVCNTLAVFNVITGAVVPTPGPAGALLIDKTPWDNRMMALGLGGDRTKISFSNPDDVATWDVDNFVSPAPDVGGQQYTATVRWREMVFVFRERAFIVFTSTSTDSVGGPIFDFRIVDYGVGAVGLHAACAAPEGVYFLAATGLYLTTGGAPQLVSDGIRPLFRDQGAPPEFTAFGGVGERISFSPNEPVSMVWRQDQLHIVLASTTATLNRRMLTYDTVRRTWSVASIGGVAVAAADPVNEARIASVGLSAQNSGLWVAGPTAHGVTDADSVWRMIPTGSGFARGQDYSVVGASLQNITGRYRSGYNDFGAPGDKTLRRSLLDGTGTVTRKVFDERNTVLPYAAETVALGASRTEDWARKSAQGRAFSVQYEAAGGFSLNRVEHTVQRLRQPLMDARV